MRGSQFHDNRFTDAPLPGVAEPIVNLLTAGSVLANAAWAKTNLSVGTAIGNLPDGTTGQYSNACYGTGGTPLAHYVDQAVTIVAGDTMLIQVYVEAQANSKKGKIIFGDSTLALVAAAATFDLAANDDEGGVSISTVAGAPEVVSSLIGATGVTESTEWYSVQMRVRLDGTTTAAKLRLQWIDDTGATTYTGADQSIMGYTLLSVSVAPTV